MSIHPELSGPKLIDHILAGYSATLGPAYSAYRNHAQRLFQLTAALRAKLDPTEQGLVAVAAAFHDLAIWTDNTLDYLEPSAALAARWLEAEGWASAAPVVRELIVRHHQLRPVGPAHDLVECFRRADLVDVSQGLLRSGIERAFYRALKAQYPFTGFHSMLLRLGARQVLRDPRHPLPMMRW